MTMNTHYSNDIAPVEEFEDSEFKNYKSEFKDFDYMYELYNAIQLELNNMYYFCLSHNSNHLKFIKFTEKHIIKTEIDKIWYNAHYDILYTVYNRINDVQKYLDFDSFIYFFYLQSTNCICSKLN